MDSLTCPLINWPFTTFNIVANVTYIFCLVCPLHGEKIKQPLKLLLASLSCSTIAFVVSGITLFYSNNLCFILASFVVFVCNFSASVTSSTGLSFFYYTQVVPAQRLLFILIKKNINAIIFCILLLEKIFGLFIAGVIIREYLILPNLILDGFNNNVTAYKDIVCLAITSPKPWTNMYIIATTIQKASFIFCLCVMVMSNGATVVYLYRHMRRMVANGQSLSCPRFSSQVRVTITGILQGVLCVFCAVWTALHSFTKNIPATSSKVCAELTVINLYMAGTTLCLGAGQAVFRQRVADIWTRAAQSCKAPKVQQSERGA
ncbi:uncharacterized protein LOC111568480 [Amphiprion ocellaris]|uniref:uncharacterized protein LOC111568480 n=1 Tax=Amphiprion ocellaris TaxID=80972 RepID=UPI002410DF00|nr:uncharacterized protein LOC111568480 [Amphiprion ocellaris]